MENEFKPYQRVLKDQYFNQGSYYSNNEGNTTNEEKKTEISNGGFLGYIGKIFSSNDILILLGLPTLLLVCIYIVYGNVINSPDNVVIIKIESVVVGTSTGDNSTVSTYIKVRPGDKTSSVINENEANSNKPSKAIIKLKDTKNIDSDITIVTSGFEFHKKLESSITEAIPKPIINISQYK